MSHDLLATLRTIPLASATKVFRHSACVDPSRWLTNRAMAVRTEMTQDQSLGGQLARMRDPDLVEISVEPEKVERAIRDGIELGCRTVRPVALGDASGSYFRGTIVRFAGPLPGPALDIDARLLRLADALLGGVDAYSSSGYFEPLFLWKRGAVAGVIMPIRWEFPPLGGGLKAGSDTTQLGPLSTEWMPDWSALRSVSPLDDSSRRRAVLEAIVRLLGGVTSKTRCCEWAVPTRAGVLRLGLAQDGTTDARFDEPLRAWRFTVPDPKAVAVEGEPSPETGVLPLPGDDPTDWRHRSLTRAMGRFRLPMAPQDRPERALLTAPAPLFQSRYQVLPRVKGWTVLDLERGIFLPGLSHIDPNEGTARGQTIDAWAARNPNSAARARASAIAHRLNAAARLAEGSRR